MNKLTSENVKDLKLMFKVLAKDYYRLASHMDILGDYLTPFQEKLAEEEENNETKRQ